MSTLDPETGEPEDDGADEHEHGDETPDEPAESEGGEAS